MSDLNKKLRLRKGDKVKVISGKDKGKIGIINKVIRSESRVIVDGVNLNTKHVKPSARNAGGIVTQESPIHISNIMYVEESTGNATRIKYEIIDGKKYRVAKKSGNKIGLISSAAN
jgi:large subunit ribosomal protein L24